MELYVKDIEKIWSNGEASLVAGKNGIMRRVDVYDMMEQPDIKPWMKKHLLVITTGYSIRNDKEAVLKVLRDMNEGNASALAIKTRFFDEFPREALELADELNLPLFLLYRKDRLRCSAELKNARTEAGMITRKSLD